MGDLKLPNAGSADAAPTGMKPLSPPRDTGSGDTIEIRPAASKRSNTTTGRCSFAERNNADINFITAATPQTSIEITTRSTLTNDYCLQLVPIINIRKSIYCASIYAADGRHYSA